MSPPHDLTERIHALETDVTVLQRDSELQTKILEKLDTSADHMQVMLEALSLKVAIHDEKMKNQERLNDGVQDLIDDRRNESNVVQQSIVKSIEDLKHDLIDRIEEKVSIFQGPLEKKRFELLPMLIENWKFIAFALAFGGGIATHKWGIFTGLFG